MTKDTRVEIYGQVYSLRTDLDPDYLQQLAQTVDAKMSALARQTDTVDTRRLAVLAALNLADELARLHQTPVAEPSSLPPDFVSRLEECSRLLDAALDTGVHE